MSEKGHFICIEGLDGCGKTTQAKFLVKKLQKNYATVYTAEPSRGSIGRFIRDYCLYRRERLSNVVEALLFAADRYEHLETEVFPALEEGKLVISDRYLYSSLAYQGAAGLDLNWIRRLNEYAIKPDLSIFLDIEPITVLRRLRRRKSVMENLATQKKVRKFYLSFVRSGELVKVNGNRSKQEVANEIARIVFKLIEKAR